MSPIMMLLSFMLPMLTAAIQTVNRDDLHTLFPSNPVGDVLNVTQCFCESSTPSSPNGTIGYVYLFDYYNFHLGRSFVLAKNCTSKAPNNSLGEKPNECVTHIDEFKKSCNTYEDNNEFCFKLKEDVNNDYNNHSISSRSKYYFNDQKRRVPAKASDILAQDDVKKDCDFYCDELGGLKTFEIPLVPGLGAIRNSIVSYSDLDDMCDDCA